MKAGYMQNYIYRPIFKPIKFLASYFSFHLKFLITKKITEFCDVMQYILKNTDVSATHAAFIFIAIIAQKTLLSTVTAKITMS